jgi:hypothetical protein
MAYNNALQASPVILTLTSGESTNVLQQYDYDYATFNPTWLHLAQTQCPSRARVSHSVWECRVAGNSLTKTAPPGWSNAGAVWTAAIASGDGDVQFTASDATTWRMCGLSNGDTDQSFQDIGFAIYPGDQGYLAIFEAGVNVYQLGPGSYVAGDRFTIAVRGSEVRYSKNGTVFYTNNAPLLRYPLLVDTALDTTGGHHSECGALGSAG